MRSMDICRIRESLRCLIISVAREMSAVREAQVLPLFIFLILRLLYKKNGVADLNV